MSVKSDVKHTFLFSTSSKKKKKKKTNHKILICCILCCYKITILLVAMMSETDARQIYKVAPPPRMPLLYPSTAYPEFSDLPNLADDPRRMAPYMQFKLVQREHQNIDMQRYLSNKAPGYFEFRLRHQHLSNYCSICSEFTSPRTGRMEIVRHRHHSTFIEGLETTMDQFGRITCTNCGPAHSPHYYKQAERTALVLSSSTMHFCLDGADKMYGFRGSPIHIEWSTISGGKFPGALHQFQAQFLGSIKPVDCLCVLGINDLGSGQSPRKIESNILKLKAAVMETGTRHPTGPSSFAVATPPWPPIWTKLTNSSHKPQADRTDEFLDLTERIIAINNSTDQNVWQTSRAPHFHKYGVVTRQPRNHDRVKSNTLEQTPYKHRYLDWREFWNKDEMLHLSDRRRVAMGLACVRYFKELYNVEYPEDHFSQPAKTTPGKKLNDKAHSIV